MSQFDEKILRQNLDSLQLNFSALNLETREAYKIFAPPSAEEVKNFWNARNAIHPKLSEMLEGDAAKRLYGAILLAEIDAEKSVEVLQKLSADETPIRVQKSVGHGFTEVSVKFPAKSFLQTGDIRTGFIETAEKLNEWKLAIAAEAKEKNLAAQTEQLPTAEQIADFDETAETPATIKTALLKLAESPLISKRFYAAVGLMQIEKTASRQILESLLDEQTPLFILRGDIGSKVPTNQIAREMLDQKSAMETEFKSQNVFGKFVQWLSKHSDNSR